MTQSAHKIGPIGVFALALAGMAPTGAMAGNIGPGTKLAGVNLPLSFILSTITMLFVAVSFYEMSKYISADGSVYAYNSASLGEHWGFISGWIMTLTYVLTAIANISLSGTYAALVLKNIGIKVSPVLLGLLLLLIAGLILYHGIKITSNVSLFTELIALIILISLCIVIFNKGGNNGFNVKPFIPTNSFSSIGQGGVYTIYCFIGFETACTISGRVKDPKHSIPIALLSTILGGAAIFLAVSYIVIMGFGTGHINQLAHSSAPLNTLASSFIGPRMASLIDFAIFLSIFGASICIINSASYMIFALGKKHYLPSHLKLGKFNYKHNAPCHAILLTVILDIILYSIVAIKDGLSTTYAYYTSIAAIGMMMIYVLINIGSFVFFKRHKEYKHSFLKHDVCPVLGGCALLFPIISNIYPMPKFPINTFPYLLIAWGIIGYIISVYHTKSLRNK